MYGSGAGQVDGSLCKAAKEGGTLIEVYGRRLLEMESWFALHGGFSGGSDV